MTIRSPYPLAIFAVVGVFVLATILAWSSESSAIASLGILICLLFGVGILLMRSRERYLIHHLNQRSDIQCLTALKTLIAEQYAMNAILNPGFAKSMPVSTWSMQFANIHAILHVVETNEPEIVVEFGSGFSTLAIARALKEKNRGRLVSFDHIEEWAALTRNQIHVAGLEEFAEVRHRPLAPQESGSLWYNLQASDLNIHNIDLLVIDGPPAVSDPRSRHPALPTLVDHLSSNAVIVLDDTNRTGEEWIISQWIDEFPEFTADKLESLTGLTILRRGSKGATK